MTGDGERCMDCGDPYVMWRAPSATFHAATGGWYGPGLLCPSCFDSRARAEGIDLLWVPHRWGRLARWWMGFDTRQSIRRWRRSPEYRAEKASS